MKRIRLHAALAAAGLAGAMLGLATAPANAATGSSAAVTAVAAPAAPPTSNLCVNESHTIPCWALTKSATTLYLRSGGTVPIGGQDKVLIQCYYISGSTVLDHVTEENSGGLHDIGHIKDSAINLNGRNPYSLQYSPNIPAC